MQAEWCRACGGLRPRRGSRAFARGAVDRISVVAGTLPVDLRGEMKAYACVLCVYAWLDELTDANLRAGWRRGVNLLRVVRSAKDGVFWFC